MASLGRIGSGAATGASTGATLGAGNPYAIAIGAVVGGIAGALSGDDGSDAAKEAFAKGLAELERIGLPPNLSAPIIYQQLKAGGKLTPELEGVLQEETFNASQVSDNAKTRTQLESALQEIRSKAFGGLSPEQMANQQKLLQQANANTQSQYKGILQGMQQRGQAGSGDAFAAMLNAAQGGAQQTSNNALQIGAQGSQAQDAALRDYLSGVGNMRSQDQSRDSTNAQLLQQANMFKAQNSSARQARNVAAGNQANQYNLSRQNQVNDFNTQQANQELLRQREAERQYWQDKLALASGKSGAYNNYGQVLSQQAANNNQNWNSMTQGIGTTAAATGKYLNDKKMADAKMMQAQNSASRSPSSISGTTPDYNLTSGLDDDTMEFYKKLGTY